MSHTFPPFNVGWVSESRESSGIFQLLVHNPRLISDQEKAKKWQLDGGRKKKKRRGRKPRQKNSWMRDFGSKLSELMLRVFSSEENIKDSQEGQCWNSSWRREEEKKRITQGKEEMKARLRQWGTDSVRPALIPELELERGGEEEKREGNAFWNLCGAFGCLQQKAFVSTTYFWLLHTAHDLWSYSF